MALIKINGVHGTQSFATAEDVQSVTNLDNLHDVTIGGSLSTGQYLVYNAVVNQWENVNTPPVVTTLNDLTDVDTTGKLDNYVLTWDSTASLWEAAPGGNYTDADVDTHLNTSTALTNEVLSWNGTDYDWVAPAAGSGTVTSVDSGTGLTGGPITTSGTLNVDVGTTANKIVQLDGSARLPAVDGSLLTGLPSGYDDADVDIHLNTSTALTNEVLSWDGTDYSWVSNTAAGYVTLTGTETLTNKTLTNPKIAEITGDGTVGGFYGGDALWLYTNYNNWSFGGSGPSENWNGALKIANWQDPGNGNKINVTQFATPESKNFFRMDAFNSSPVSGNGVVEDISVTAGSFVTGKKYKITNVGNTTQAQWETAGLSSTLTAAAEMVFTATSAGVGTGTADKWDTGQHTVSFGLKGGDDIGFYNASTGLIVGRKYKIFYAGDTVWTDYGSADNNVNTEFVCDAVGSSGTGVAVDMRPGAGVFNQFSCHTGAQSPPGWDTNLEFDANKIRFHNSYVFPTSDGTAGQVLQTDGDDQLSWESLPAVSNRNVRLIKTKVEARTYTGVAGESIMISDLYLQNPTQLAVSGDVWSPMEAVWQTRATPGTGGVSITTWWFMGSGYSQGFNITVDFGRILAIDCVVGTTYKILSSYLDFDWTTIGFPKTVVSTTAVTVGPSYAIEVLGSDNWALIGTWTAPVAVGDIGQFIVVPNTGYNGTCYESGDNGDTFTATGQAPTGTPNTCTDYY